jgi:CheY-like chemotaxis protein
MMDTVRVLIADDHPLFREGIRGRLDRVADVAVVEEAESGDDAVQMAKEFEPDVIHMDLKMPGLNGSAKWCLAAGRHVHGGGSTLPALSVALTSQVLMPVREVRVALGGGARRKSCPVEGALERSPSLRGEGERCGS